MKEECEQEKEEKMKVLHVDANSAYLSWTAVHLLESGYPVDLRTVPAVIAGNPESRHGIILAKSLAAKKMDGRNISCGQGEVRLFTGTSS